MAVSFTHQAEYVYKLFKPHTDEAKFLQVLDSGVAVICSLLIPLVFDGLTLVCIKAISTKGLVKKARTLGLSFLVVPVSMSGYVNVKGSDTAELAIVFALVVACIPVIELIKSAMDPDYSEMDALERRVMATLDEKTGTSQDAPAPVVIDHDETDPFEMFASMNLDVAKAMAGYDNMAPAERTSWSRKVTNAAKRIDDRRSEREAKAAALAGTK
jgi:hypothetical protein